MQGVEAQALTRQPSIERRHAEGQGGASLMPVALDGAKRLPQLGYRLGHGWVSGQFESLTECVLTLFR